MVSTIRIANKDFTPSDVIEHARKAAGWFRLIGVFSLVNMALGFFDTQIVFVLGLGAAMVVDAVAAAARASAEGVVANVVTVVAVLVNLLIVGSFFLIWYLAQRGSMAAYVVGLVLYALDSLIMLAAQDWVGIGFHAFFGFAIVGGLSFVRVRKSAEAAVSAAAREAAAPTASHAPPPLPVS